MRSYKYIYECLLLKYTSNKDCVICRKLETIVSSQESSDAMQVPCHIRKINKLSPHHQLIATIKTIHKSDDKL